MRKALFLDRDGVVISDSGYVKDPSTVRLIPGVSELIQRANQSDWSVVVVTNQSGIGRGWISIDDYKAVSARMIELLAEKSARLDQIYFSPFYAVATASPYPPEAYQFIGQKTAQVGRWDSAWRKPNAGMLQQAASDLNLDLANSVMVGDRHTDFFAARSGRVKTFYFLHSEVFAVEMQELQKLEPLVLTSEHPGIEFQVVHDLGEVRLI